MEIGVVYIAIVIGIILISMTLHEAMHAFSSYWLGDDTAKSQGRLTLNPIRHIDPFLTIILPVMLALLGGPIFGGAKPVPFNPGRVRYGDWGSAIIAIAGPLTNLLLAFLAFGFYALLGVPGGLVGEIIFLFVIVNLGFFVFNILPIPPLDGSRVLYALAPEFFRRIMESIEKFGIFFILILVLVAAPYIGSVMAVVINSILEFFSKIFAI